MSFIKKGKEFTKKIFSRADSLRGILALLIFLVGVILGVYYGVVVMFVGGIVDAITAIAADPILVGQLTVGILKFVFSEIAGFAVFGFFALIAWFVGGN